MYKVTVATKKVKKLDPNFGFRANKRNVVMADLELLPHLSEEHLLEKEYWTPMVIHRRGIVFSTMYLISTFGRVMNYETGRILKNAEIDGLKVINPTIINEQGKREVGIEYIHNLMSWAYEIREDIPEDNTLTLTVQHDNGYKADNHLLNLVIRPRKSIKQGKVYYFISPEGKYIKVVNLSEYCKKNSLNRSVMTRLHQGRVDGYKGWKKA